MVYLSLLADVEPISFDQAIKEARWKKAMMEELNSIEKNQTWQLVPLPPHMKLIGVKWIFKIKEKPNEKVAKYKARLVARGFLQKQ